jgi:hypothetical protein
MDIGGFHVPSIVSAGGTFASIYGAFSRFDRIQSRANRKFVSAWLKGLKAPQAEWSTFFLEIFEKFFGAEHLSVKCFKRSVLLSAFLIFMTTAVTALITEGPFPTDPRDMYTLIFAGCLTDYLSLWKTRWLLTRFDLIRKRITVLGLIAVDLIGTTPLFGRSYPGYRMLQRRSPVRPPLKGAP